MESQGKGTPAELDEDDVIAFDRLLQSQGKTKTTRALRYGYLRCFLRHCGLNPSRSDDNDESTGVVAAAAHKKLIAKPKLAVEKYSEADLQKLDAASAERHRLIWRTFRMLGLRDQDLAYGLWAEIDWEQRLWLVRFKPAGSFPWNRDLAWKPKGSEERDIPIPQVLYTDIAADRDVGDVVLKLDPTSTPAGSHEA